MENEVLQTIITVVISSTIIIVGWFYNAEKNREMERFKIGLQYRIDMLRSFLPIYFSLAYTKTGAPFIDDKELPQKLEDVRTKFQLYGCDDENTSFEMLIKAIETRNIAETNKWLFETVTLVRKKIREELGIKDQKENFVNKISKKISFIKHL